MKLNHVSTFSGKGQVVIVTLLGYGNSIVCKWNVEIRVIQKLRCVARNRLSIHQVSLVVSVAVNDGLLFPARSSTPSHY